MPERWTRQGAEARAFNTNHDRVQPAPSSDVTALSIPMLLAMLGGGYGDVDIVLGMLGALERDLDATDEIARLAQLAGANANLNWSNVLAPILVRCRVAHELLSRERRAGADTAAALDRAHKVAALAVELAALAGCSSAEEGELRRIRAEVNALGLDETTTPLREIAERELDRIGSVHSRKAQAQALADYRETTAVGDAAKTTAEAEHWKAIDAKRAPAPVAPATVAAGKRKPNAPSAKRAKGAK